MTSRATVSVLLLFPAISVGLVQRQDAPKHPIEHLALPRLQWGLADLLREPVHVLRLVGTQIKSKHTQFQAESDRPITHTRCQRWLTH